MMVRFVFGGTQTWETAAVITFAERHRRARHCGFPSDEATSCSFRRGTYVHFWAIDSEMLLSATSRSWLALSHDSKDRPLGHAGVGKTYRMAFSRGELEASIHQLTANSFGWLIVSVRNARTERNARPCFGTLPASPIIG